MPGGGGPRTRAGPESVPVSPDGEGRRGARMSPTALLVVLVVPLVAALGLGIWIGLGYPGLYDRYESAGRGARRTPFQMLVDWLVGLFDR